MKSKNFEEHLSGEHRTIMNMLRIIERAMPTFYHPKARTGRPPYDDMAFFRAFFALSYSKGRAKNRAPLDPAKKGEA